MDEELLFEGIGGRVEGVGAKFGSLLRVTLRYMTRMEAAYKASSSKQSHSPQLT